MGGELENLCNVILNLLYSETCDTEWIPLFLVIFNASLYIF